MGGVLRGLGGGTTPPAPVCEGPGTPQALHRGPRPPPPLQALGGGVLSTPIPCA